MANRVIRSSFRGGSRRGGKLERKKQWLGAFTISPTAMASGSLLAVAIVPNATLAVASGGGAKGTLVRTRGWLQWAPDVAGEDPQAIFGLAVVDERAFGIGTTALPTASDLEDLFWFSGAAITNFVSTAASGPMATRLEIDSKAMRKYEVTDTIVLLATAGSTGHAASLHFDINCLLMEQ